MNNMLKNFILKKSTIALFVSSSSLVVAGVVLPNTQIFKNHEVKDYAVEQTSIKNDQQVIQKTSQSVSQLEYPRIDMNDDKITDSDVIVKVRDIVPVIKEETIEQSQKVETGVVSEGQTVPEDKPSTDIVLEEEKNDENEVPEVSDSESDEDVVLPEDEEKQETPEVVEEPKVEEEEKEESVPPTEEEKQDSPEVNEAPKVEETENYAEVLEEAARRTQNVDSAYYRFSQTGYSVISVKYNKSQNREYTVTDEGEEYLEGMPGRYTQDWDLSSYYKQDWWRKESGSTEWINKGRIHSGFGMAPLSFLNHVKSATLVSTRPFKHYKVVIDKDMANKAADVQFSNPNMFKTDVTLEVSINHEGYIVLLNLDCKKDVLNDGVSEVSLWLHAGDFNKTTVQRPKDLANVTITDAPKKDELTPTKKVQIKDEIKSAYQRTMNVNSATYETNGKVVQYNRQQNSALITKDGNVTYYKGEDGKYINHDYVSLEFQQDSWTKNSGSDTWVKNVKKHTTFTPTELYFLNVIFDVTKVETNNDVTTYTITVLNYYANLAYSHVYGVSNKFSDNISLKVSLKDGYVYSLSSDFGLNLKLHNINNTTIDRPVGIE